MLRHEEHNHHDIRAAAIIKDSAVVGHMPRETAGTVWFFLRRGGSGVGEVTGKRKKGIGLKVPCVYTFSGPEKLVKRLQSIFQECSLSCSCPY